MANQFIDKFKYLKTEDAKIRNLRTRVTQILNQLLPSRILSKANIFNLTLDLSQDYANMMMVYIENSLVESNILTAQNESSVRGLATMPGHNATRPISSRGVLRCTLKQGLQLITPKLILSNVVVVCESNKLQYTGKIVGDIQEVSTSVAAFDIEVIEGRIKTAKVVSDGSKLFTVELDDTDAIENYDISVTVDNEQFDKYDSLYDMGAMTKGFYMKNGFGNQVDIVLGDGIHGVLPREGATIIVTYRLTNGEAGNLQNNAQTWSFNSGIYNAAGEEIDIAEYIDVKIQSGFQLGSNGENIELTRNLAGYNSRSLVFAKPENIQAYLSRLSILSKIDVWTENDDNVYNMLLLPNVMTKFKRYSDYLYADTSEFALTAGVKTDIKQMLDASRRQATSSEIVMHDPIFRRYAIFVYIDAVINDKDALRIAIEDKVSAVMIAQTFAETSIDKQIMVSKSAIVDAIYDMPEIKNLSTDIISEQNENARINGYFDYKVTEMIGSVQQTRTERRTIPATTNPNIGFTDLGDMKTLERKEVPILRGGFSRFVDSNTTVEISKPVYIFYKTTNNTWDEL